MVISYNRQGDVIEIIIRDSTFKKVEVHKFNSSDIKVANKVLGYIASKYGYKPLISHEDSINNKDANDFLNMDVKW